MKLQERSTGQPPILAKVWRSRTLLLLLAMLSMALLMGCSQGSYPLDFFPEMHYNQSYKIQEPPSLSAPVGSVPITGREVAYTLEQARALQNPVPINPDTLEQGAELYQVNCAVCHGSSGLGDGPMKNALAGAGYASAPANLTASGPTVAKPDGEVFLIITGGFARTYGLPEGAFVMPPFAKLLTEEERWTLISYLRTLQE